MIPPLLSLLAGGVLLYIGAEGLVRGGASLALRLGLPALVVGLTVVAFGTSAPEMVVSVGAAIEGRGAIAAGNIVGSNICNIGLILGVAALIRPLYVQAQVIRIDMPIALGVSVLAMALLADDRVGRPEGLLLLAGIVAYVGLSIRLARADPQQAAVAEFVGGMGRLGRTAAADLAFVLGGVALLAAGARLFVGGAVELAEMLGISQTVIALTVVAVGTSLPELATSVVAAVRGAADISVGNIVGSNIFNVLAILGASATARPLAATGIATFDLLVMIALSVALLPLMRSGFRITRLEGAVLLAGYVAYTAYLLR